jgi:hypothetical protein
MSAVFQEQAHVFFHLLLLHQAQGIHSAFGKISGLQAFDPQLQTTRIDS